MILGDSNPAAALQAQSRMTLDELIRRTAQRRPDALALIDAPNRRSFTDGAPRRLTYAEADRMVSAIAGRLRRMGLTTDAVVGVQLPTIVENVLTILGVLRAGMIVAPLPLLWRRADMIAALARVGAKALITCGQVASGQAGTFNHGQLALRVAAEVFSIRYVCGFGKTLADGIVPFDDLFDAEKLDPVPPLERERQTNAAAHVAAVTFDVGEGGLLPVARNHSELIAGGLGVVLESRLAPETVALSTIAPSSFAGISLTVLPWLLTGGALALHHPFDEEVFGRQRRETHCGTVMLPGPVALRLAETGALARGGPVAVIAAWRSPERLAMSPAWREPDAALTDVAIFGEAGLVPARRGAGGRPSAIPVGQVVTPRGSSGGVVVAEVSQTDAGTVALRGAMVPHHAFPPGVERSGLPYFKIGRGGLVDSGYTCHVDAAAKTMVVTGPPMGIVGVGGYRFPLHDLQDVVGRIDGTATLAGLPDPLIGQRLVGTAADAETIQAALSAVGVNPIVTGAFRGRGGDRGAAVPAADGR
jgi:hypothetical protein